MLKTNLFASGRAEAACAAQCFVQIVNKFKFCGIVGSKDYLRDPLAAFYCLWDAAVIVKRYHHLSAIVAVNDSDFICGGKSFFGCKTAACINKSYKAFGYFERKTGGDKASFRRRYGNCFVKAGIKIRAC